jgi:hypothetical protein
MKIIPRPSMDTMQQPVYSSLVHIPIYSPKDKPLSKVDPASILLLHWLDLHVPSGKLT